MKALSRILVLGAVTLLLTLGLTPPGSGQDKPLIVGVDGTFAPHAMPKIGGGVEGFNVDLALEIGKRLGRKTEIVSQEFSGLIPGMNAGKFDYLAAPTTVMPERAKNLLFSEGYLETDYQFAIPFAKPDIKALEDLKGKIITVNKGSNYEMWCRENEAKYGFKFESYGTNTDAVQAVLSGRADANLAGMTVAAYAVKRVPQQLKLSYKIKTGLVWALAFRKDDVKGRKMIEEAMECMKVDHSLSALAEKWFGFKPDATSPAVVIYPGYGVPGFDGYDPTEHKPNCK